MENHERGAPPPNEPPPSNQPPTIPPPPQQPSEGKDKDKGKDKARPPDSGAEARAEEAAAEFDDAQGGVDGRTVVTDSVTARAAFLGSTLRIDNLIIGGEEGGRGGEQVVTSIEITAAVASAEATFVEPRFFAPLVEAVTGVRVAVVAGPGGGKESAGGAALRRAGHDPIRQLPGDLRAAELVRAVVKLAGDRAGIGILVDGVDSETLTGLGGFELQRLKSAMGEHRGALVVTSGDERVAHMVDTGLPVVEVETGEGFAVAVADRHAAAREAGPADLERIHVALDLLAPPVAPRVVVAVVADAIAHPDKAAEEIAARFQQGVTDEVLAPWLRRHRSARALAGVAAALTLERAPLADVDAAAIMLERRLEGPSADGASGTVPRARFAVEDREWPEGVLTIARERFGTHYGHPETDVPRLCPPHDRERAIASLWNTLGPAFREPYLDWLRDAAGRRSLPVRSGAAITAGILFCVDPLIAERDLLRPWALDGRATHRACAALAVGTPAALGGDPTASRALVKSWGTTDDERLRRVAVLAYGGLLGAWDPGAAAAAHLWRIGEETPKLRPMADAGLASLTAAGAHATRARATVMGVLVGRLEDRRSRPRVYGVVPLIARELTRSHLNARGSLQAFSDEDDGRTRADYATLLARAFDAPDPGFRSACRALQYLLDAASRGRLDDVWLEGLVRKMRDDARPRDREVALGSQLQRALRAERRRRSAGAETAARLLTLFFRPTTPGGTPA